MLRSLFANKYLLFLIFIPMLNLLFMHYYFYFTHILEWTWMYSEFLNLCGVVFDVSVLIIVALFLTGGRVKPSLAVTQIITLIWSYVNVTYGKFFFQYISLSAIGEAHGLGDGLVINSVMSAFCWYDLFYLISAILFIFVYRKVGVYKIHYKKIMQLLYLPVLSIIMTFVAYSTYHFVHPHYRNNWELYKFRAKEFLFDSVRGGTPNLAHFQIGCVRVAIYEIYDMLRVTELTLEQRTKIEEFYQDHSYRTTHHIRNPRINNVIFILLESFLSAPIDLKVDGKEITPFLNSLKNDSNVYYNSNMISDIGCGESGDGQFIYMTGLLPLKYKMTVGQVKNNVLPALPKVLKEKMGIINTEIIYPTMPNLWQQADMNVVYGIDTAFSLTDIVGDNKKNIDDKDIFDFAAKNLDDSKGPFFSLILSVSTHSPYDKFVGEDLEIKKTSFSDEYRNYLCTCHYLDCQLQKYFHVLKTKGVYDKSLIVIASDHHAHLDMLKMDGKITNHCPLFIVNGNIQNNDSCQGEFHQVDVYSTLLDVLMINQPWLGLGHTLLNKADLATIDAMAIPISDLIVEGDYFAK